MYYYDHNLDYTSLSNDHNVYDLDEMCETYMHNTSLDMQLDAMTMMMSMHEIHMITSSLHTNITHDIIRKHHTRYTCTHRNAL